MPEKIFYTFLDSTVLGKIGIASSSSGIVLIKMRIKENIFLNTLKKNFSAVPIKSEKINAQAVNELKSYLRGELEIFKSSLDIRGTSFQKRVLETAKKIPYGKTCSYKFLACEVANVKYSRAVGNVMAKNSIPIFIPCHRVIKSGGELGNYGAGRDLKIKLLELEGAI